MTVIYRRLDLQTRELVPIRGSSSVGGIRNDNNFLTLYFEVPNTLENQGAYITFDIINPTTHKNFVYMMEKEQGGATDSSQVVFKHKVKIEVMSRIGKNKLTQQLAFFSDDGSSQSEIDTVMLTDHDSLMIGNSLFDSFLASDDSGTLPDMGSGSGSGSGSSGSSGGGSTGTGTGVDLTVVNQLIQQGDEEVLRQAKIYTTQVVSENVYATVDQILSENIGALVVKVIEAEQQVDGAEATVNALYNLLEQYY